MDAAMPLQGWRNPFELTDEQKQARDLARDRRKENKRSTAEERRINALNLEPRRENPTDRLDSDTAWRRPEDERRLQRLRELDAAQLRQYRGVAEAEDQDHQQEQQVPLYLIEHIEMTPNGINRRNDREQDQDLREQERAQRLRHQGREHLIDDISHRAHRPDPENGNAPMERQRDVGDFPRVQDGRDRGPRGDRRYTEQLDAIDRRADEDFQPQLFGGFLIAREARGAREAQEQVDGQLLEDLHQQEREAEHATAFEKMQRAGDARQQGQWDWDRGRWINAWDERRAQ